MQVVCYLYRLGGYSIEKVLKLITGESNEVGRDYLNEFYKDSLFRNGMTTDLHIQGRKGDYHYLEQVVPFNFDVKDYFDHGQNKELFYRILN
ncbi:hypothetical protein IE3_00288 [Bacillus cereus BAG3X2-1]|nr:hypothetical protein IE3_00288 [Bacillus cereus BAG3X2-1]PEA19339.1 hypothetical protein CON40_20165 [Bacillus cereus]PEV97070.1 hypothetical protein CN428_25565 [Bacillus cereus]